jgi:SAM-dependent methyltransferase
MKADLWSARAEAFRESDVHRAGRDLDLLVEWAAGGRTALDVATGGGHVARRLREAGLEVVSSDPAPGMAPDVICRAEDLPFADASFDVVVCRRAAHHFGDVRAALGEMARVSRRLVLVEDLLYDGEDAEEAHRIRDPSHVRSLSEAEWRDLFESTGLDVEEVELFPGRGIPYEPWLERVGCRGEEAERVRELLGDRIQGDRVSMPGIALKGRKERALLSYYVKLLGAGDMPLGKTPFRDREDLLTRVRFPKDQFPRATRRGDELVYYAVGGYKRLFAVARGSSMTGPSQAREG